MQTNLRKDYFWNTVGVFGQNALSPLLLVVVTRLNGMGDSGVFSFAFSMAVLFWSFNLWGGRMYQVSDVKRKYSSSDYVTARLLLSVVTLLASIIFVVVNQYDITKSIVIISLVSMKVVEAIADVLYGIMQVNGRLYVSGISLAVKFLASLGSFAVVNFITHDLILSCISLVVVNVIGLLIYDIPKTRALERIEVIGSKFKKRLASAKQIIIDCTPVFAVMFMAMFSLNIPRYFLDKSHPDEVAYFGIFAMPITLIVLLVSFMLQPNVVRLSKLYNSGRTKEFGKYVGKTIIGALIIGIASLLAVWLWGKEVVNLVFDVDISENMLSLIVMVAGAIFNAIVAVYMVIYTIMRRFKLQFYILLISNTILFVVCLVAADNINLVIASSLFAAISFLQASLLTVNFVFRMKGIKR